MMENLLKIIADEFKKENGDDAKMGEGDEFALVFNDGLLIISVEDDDVNIKVVLGKPNRVDKSLLDLLGE